MAVRKPLPNYGMGPAPKSPAEQNGALTNVPGASTNPYPQAQPGPTMDGNPWAGPGDQGGAQNWQKEQQGRAPAPQVGGLQVDGGYQPGTNSGIGGMADPSNWPGNGPLGAGAGGANPPVMRNDFPQNAPVLNADGTGYSDGSVPGGVGLPPIMDGGGAEAKPGSTAYRGGGWDDFAQDPKSFEYGLSQALANGMKGEDAIDWMQANGWAGAKNGDGTGVAYYADRDQFGLNGTYVAPGADGAYDLIKRQEAGAPGRQYGGMQGATAMPGSMFDVGGVSGEVDPSLQQAIAGTMTNSQGGSSPNRGAAPEGAHQNPDGTWDWDSPTGGAGEKKPGAPSQQNLDEATRSQLLKMLNPDAINGDTLMTSPEAASQRIASQRGVERQMAQAAEDAARSGMAGSGGQDGIMRGIRQHAAEGESEFIGTLAIQKVQQQIEDKRFALQQAQQAGQFDKAQALQKELTQMQDATQRYGIQTGADTSRYGIDRSAETSKYGIDSNRSIARDQLGLGYAGLGQNDRQFNDRMGFDYTQLGANMNRDALLALLSGGR
jgi:hypothetical protein